MYGHLRDYKGWQELLDAFEAVTASGHTFTLDIAGKASRDTVRSVRERIGRMEERARTGIRLFIGAEQVVAPDTAASLFAAADAVMLPYRAVTFSAVMLQALAAGRPVIAANLPGLAESLDPQRAGWLYQPGSHARLCEAMVTAISRGPNAGFPEAEIQKGLLRLHAWDSAGVQTANVYRGLGAPV
jgi:glycosyltransferase involved in cell wall biosynthesis